MTRDLALARLSSARAVCEPRLLLFKGLLGLRIHLGFELAAADEFLEVANNGAAGDAELPGEAEMLGRSRDLPMSSRIWFWRLRRSVERLNRS